MASAGKYRVLVDMFVQYTYVNDDPKRRTKKRFKKGDIVELNAEDAERFTQGVPGVLNSTPVEAVQSSEPTSAATSTTTKKS